MKNHSSNTILVAFQRHKNLIASVLRRFKLSQIDIEDMTQETIVRALEAHQRTDIKEPKAFLVGITKNVARTELTRRHKMLIDLLDDFDPDTYLSEGRGVDDEVESLQRMKTFSQTVATLPPQCQKVFILKHVYGASHREIAHKLGIALSTVEKHAALGLKRCREAMLNAESRDGEHSRQNIVAFNPQQRRRS